MPTVSGANLSEELLAQMMLKNEGDFYLGLTSRLH